MNANDRRVPKRWTDTEDDILYREARSQLANGQLKDWNRIAAKLPGRTNKDCRKRWINKVCGSLKKGSWDESEDERLREAVRIHGQKWAIVANMVGLRSPDQCAKRWQYSLDPRLHHREWTPEEDKILLSMVKTHGREWKLIHEQEFPTRSRNELKNRYSALARKCGITSDENKASRPVPSLDNDRLLEEATQRTDGGASSGYTDEAGDSSAHQVNSNTYLQWENGRVDDMLVDAWVDSLGADWVRHMGTPSSGSPASACLSLADSCSLSGSGGNIAVDLQTTRQPGSGPPIVTSEPSNELPDLMRDSSPLQWHSGTSDVTAQPAFFPIPTVTDEWDADTTLLMETHLQQSTLALANNSQDTTMGDAFGHEPFVAPSTGPMRKISLTVNQCDSNTLEHLLACVKKMKGKAKLEIDV